MRPRQPGDLDVDLCYDFAPVMPLRGYTYLECRESWMGEGEGRVTLLRESKAGRELTQVALRAPELEDKARWQVVVRPRGEQRVLSSQILEDVDADFGWSEGAARDTVTAYMQSYTGMMAGVVLPPSPSQAPPVGVVGTYSTLADVASAPAETVALSLISRYFGPAAPLTANRFSRLSIPTDLGRGANVTTAIRYRYLLDELRTICEVGGITVRLMQGAPGVVNVVVTEQQQRPEVTLSRERNTLLAWRVRGSAARANAALVAGKGEGTARAVTQVNVTPPAGGWAYPRRTIVSATSEDQLAPMQEAAREELAELNRPTAVSLRPAPTARWVPGIDFDLGDRLTVGEAGEVADVRVEEIVTTHREGEAPTVDADAGPVGGSWLAQKINRITRALGRDLTR